MIKDVLPYILIFIMTLFSTAFFVANFIPIFSKSAKQPIYEGGPSWHMKKSGTPTMGGVGFLLPVMLIGLIFCIPLQLAGNKEAALSVFISLMFALSNAMIGLLDDLTKLRHKENRGLTPGEKIFLQTVSVALFLAARAIFLGTETAVLLFSYNLELGAFYYPAVGFILLGIINCANLTDGIDGLASTVAFAAGISLFYSAFPYHETASVISAALIGATVGFLIFNIHPAKIFMGDTGSLFLGSLVASAALDAGGPVLALGTGIVYVIEGVSVVLQVAVFKIAKRRIFKMAPLHHHLEKSGWSENKICISAILLTLLSSLIVSSLQL